MDEQKRKVLIVDDEPGIRDSLRLLLKNSFQVQAVEDGEQALAVMDEFSPDVVLLDVMMPKLDGLETLKRLRERSTVTPVIMLTAANQVKTAVQAMKWGAVDYINKPFEIEELTRLMLACLDQNEGAVVVGGASRKALTSPAADFGTMVGRASAMVNVFEKVNLVAPRDTTVLITGDSGTGKELVARRIHDLSARKDKPFVAINCAAIPESLIESELFGHEKGAFTHAVEKRIGYFELADGGTLLLDEIGELSLNVQVKMLRFLQEQEFYRVGRSKPVKVDVRIIAATNKDLEKLIKEKKFRQDLFYRINVINIKVPPLRDRFEDIPHLVQHFIDKYRSVYGDRTLQIAEEAMATLVQYSWPGNVRELENAVESLMALTASETINDEDLPRKFKARDPLNELKTNVFEGEINFEEAERKFELEMIVKALKKTSYVQTKAAELLGISRRILKYKMDKLGISDKPEVATEVVEPAPVEAVEAVVKE